jgi:hypothetical protein
MEIHETAAAPSALGAWVDFAGTSPSEKTQRIATRSMAALAEHYADLATKQRAEDERERALIEVAYEPIAKLIGGDLHGARIAELHLNDLVGDLSGQSAKPRIMVAPYDFTWSWHNENANPPHNQVFQRSTGRVALDARSGAVAGGASGAVEAHAGYGVVLTTDHPMPVVGRALRRARYSVGIEAVGVGSNATATIGMELTALEDGKLIAIASDTIWRKRVSGSLFSPYEKETDQQGPAMFIEPRELAFFMQPGREYTFNVGIWVRTDRSFGIGAGAAYAQLDANILLMSLFSS